MTIPSRQHLDTAHSIASTAPSTVIAYAVLFVLFVYYTLQYLDFPVLSFSELAWNTLVYITPSRVISFLHPSSDWASSEAGLSDNSSRSVGYAKKSEAMRHILGLDGAGIMTNVQRVRSLPGVGAVVKATPSNAPPGLGNWDNSCYQNSILQGLASLRSLPDYIDQNKSAEAGESMRVALRDLLSRLNDGSNAGKMFWTPAILKSMSSWQQQDAQEYFSKVLDEVEKELSKSAPGPSKCAGLASLADLEEKLPKIDLSLSSDRVASSKARSSTRSRIFTLPGELASMIIRNPLEGLLAQRVGCLQCGYVEGLSLIPFNCLTVPLGRQWTYDIRSCLDEYTGLEPINGVECAKCTLLHTRRQLERLLARIQAHKNEDDASHAPQLPQVLEASLQERLSAVKIALADEDFSDSTLSKKCQINSKSRISTTKSRQAVIARAPRSLAIHVNRSVFDELTGAQTKNFADVRFPDKLDLSSWCLGGGVVSDSETEATEQWTIDPARSMLSPDIQDGPMHLRKEYELRAVVTHYGRHENGHYICYRRYPSSDPKGSWWRLSDEDVSQVSENVVLSQGGVFMLFYEQITPPPSVPDAEESEAKAPEHHLVTTLLSSTENNAAEVARNMPETPQAGLEEATDNRGNTERILLASVEQSPEKTEHTQEDLPDKQEIAIEAPSDRNEAEADTEGISKSATDVSTYIPPEQVSPSALTLQVAEHAQNRNLAKSDQPLSQKVAQSLDSGAPASEVALHAPAPEEASKEKRQTVPTVRTPTRTGFGSPRRGSKGMGQVSSMVTAN
ncbi:MAG: hypothetical protein Q9191_004717 [Dirinaria sp. TL-2023a]